MYAVAVEQQFSHVKLAQYLQIFPLQYRINKSFSARNSFPIFDGELKHAGPDLSGPIKIIRFWNPNFTTGLNKCLPKRRQMLRIGDGQRTALAMIFIGKTYIIF